MSVTPARSACSCRTATAPKQHAGSTSFGATLANRHSALHDADTAPNHHVPQFPHLFNEAYCPICSVWLALHCHAEPDRKELSSWVSIIPEVRQFNPSGSASFRHTPAHLCTLQLGYKLAHPPTHHLIHRQIAQGAGNLLERVNLVSKNANIWRQSVHYGRT